ncbi:MAG TPA: IclR family transcriptional regulator [Actinomycetota bacterium]|nr:IclR family transcriptional regulator [Actinomycetota bacterium]
MRNVERSGVQSVARALAILEELAGGELGVTELGRRLGVHKATASRLVATLADRGLVERDPSTDKFRLGFGLIHLAGAAMAGLDLVHEAHPVLEDLAERTRETVNLAVRDGDSVMHVDQIAGTRSVVSVSWVGRRTPYHCTSNGKVLLAFLGDAERARLLAAPLERRTANTIVDPDALRAQLAEVATRGYAFTVEELEEGLNAVAAPIRGAAGEVVAAVSVSGPAFRFLRSDIERVGRIVMDAAGAISRRMGYVERRQSVGG